MVQSKGGQVNVVAHSAAGSKAAKHTRDSNIVDAVSDPDWRGPCVPIVVWTSPSGGKAWKCGWEAHRGGFQKLAEACAGWFSRCGLHAPMEVAGLSLGAVDVGAYRAMVNQGSYAGGDPRRSLPPVNDSV